MIIFYIFFFSIYNSVLEILIYLVLKVLYI